MTSSKTSEAFLALVRSGIGHGSSGFPEEVDWAAIKALADQHGLSAIVLDGIEKMPKENRPIKEDRLAWIGETLQVYEYRFDLYRRVIAEMAGWHNRHGFKMMILKGYVCAINWPKPEHRPCGDIDIWQFGKQKEADAVLAKEKGIEVDTSHHHHTVFCWRGFMVENHYDFLNTHHHRSNVEMEKILKDLGKDDSHFMALNGEKVYIPAPNLHALFLLRHSMSNFASTGLQLRQLLDWAFFVEKQGGDVDWKWLLRMVERFGMKPLFDVFNGICVEDLGFAPTLFPYGQLDFNIKERVLNDILFKEFSEIEEGGYLRRAVFKFRRWRANAWKHELCFNESMWSAFWSGVKSHLLKPSSI